MDDIGDLIESCALGNKVFEKYGTLKCKMVRRYFIVRIN